MPTIEERARAVENRIAEWLKQPGTFVTPAETQFISDMRRVAALGVGYGWMQQIIEWEWQSVGSEAWGPEYFQKRISAIEAETIERCAAVLRKRAAEACSQVVARENEYAAIAILALKQPEQGGE